VISQQLYDLLSKRAQQAQTSPEHLAEVMLSEHLTYEGNRWRQELEALIARVYARTARFDPAEIEDDISAAFKEVRKMRRAQHRTYPTMPRPR
jgi:hypothetical protein